MSLCVSEEWGGGEEGLLFFSFFFSCEFFGLKLMNFRFFIFSFVRKVCVFDF